METAKRFDVVVVGAGPAGSVCAYALARFGHRVALLERSEVPDRKIGESLPAVSRRVLEKLELAELLTNPAHHDALGNVSAWGSSDLECKDFLDDPDGLGWHLDRPEFERQLRNKAMGAGAVLIKSALRTVERKNSFLVLRTDSDELASRFVVDATGRSAKVATQLGATREADDELIAICAWANRLETDVEKRTLIESAADGWWYSSPVPDGRRVVAYHMLQKDAAFVLNTDGEFRRRLEMTSHVSKVLKWDNIVGKIVGKEASGQMLKPCFGERWIAVGDAAIAFDPLSSQGMYNALYTGMKAGQAVKKYLQTDHSRTENMSSEAENDRSHASELDDQFQAYAQRLLSIRKVYIARRRSVYRTEMRFPEREFWKRFF